MADPAAVISAVAACAAAVLAGGTFWVTGQRDERKWRREAMVDTLVAFFEASFDGGGERLLDARARNDDLTHHQERVAEVHRTQMGALTRLRLLAPNDVVDGAERLRVADARVHAAALNPASVPEPDAWEALRRDQSVARQNLLDKSRGALGLGAAKEIAITPRLVLGVDQLP